MPVDQSGENILFVLDGKSVEAHVQIQYQGDPARFAWIVPMPAVPTVTAGSEQLFDNLLQATVPSYGLTQQFDSCPCPNCGFIGTGGASSGPPLSIAADGGVSVLFQKTVGAFEVTALSGHSSQEVIDWLSNNGYQNAASAPSLLDAYVKKGSVFVAVKLTAGAGLNQIHPLVFKYAGNEACIPLQLTAVAAVEDMGVRAFFLGDDRYVSTNYEQITVNPARLDWTKNGGNYTSVVSRAVDEAGGHAFVTEYAGASSAVTTYNLSNPAWDETAFTGIDPRDVIDELSTQGLITCNAGPPANCYPNHPLILPLLREFLPPPPSVDEATFYSCVQCFQGDAGLSNFSASAFTTALSERIFQPGRHAAAMLARFPYLTRLFTTISPSEMTVDPLFAARSDLPQVASGGVFATERNAQNGARGVTLPDARQVALDGTNWPAFTSAMPWTELIQDYPAGNPAKTVKDNGSAIDAELTTWNASKSWPPPPPNCPNITGDVGGFGGASSGGVGAGKGGVSTGVSQGGSDETGGSSSSAAFDGGGSSGGCSVTRDVNGAAWPWATLAAASAVVTVTRRRKRRKSA